MFGTYNQEGVGTDMVSLVIYLLFCVDTFPVRPSSMGIKRWDKIMKSGGPRPETGKGYTKTRCALRIILQTLLPRLAP